MSKGISRIKERVLSKISTGFNYLCMIGKQQKLLSSSLTIFCYFLFPSFYLLCKKPAHQITPQRSSSCTLSYDLTAPPSLTIHHRSSQICFNQILSFKIYIQQERVLTSDTQGTNIGLGMYIKLFIYSPHIIYIQITTFSQILKKQNSNKNNRKHLTHLFVPYAIQSQNQNQETFHFWK